MDTRKKSTKTPDYHIVKELYEEFLEEKNLLDHKMEASNNTILEIDRYLKSLFEKEEEDYEVFSPRNVESLYKDVILEQKNSKKEQEEKLTILSGKRLLISSKLDKLEFFLNEVKNYEENEIQVDEAVEMKNSEKEELLFQGQNINSKMVDIEDPVKEVNTTKHLLTDLDSKEKTLSKEEYNIIILDIQEKERQRIARDLHDSTVQNLTHLIHKVELCGKFMDQDVIRAKLELFSIGKNVREIINDMRNTIFNLRPMIFDDIGIVASFERLFSEMQLTTSMEIHYSIDEIISSNELLLITILHVVKEYCENAIKHSKGSELSVTVLNKAKELQIEIKDNGVGFDVTKSSDDHHFGLEMTKERITLLSGTTRIDSIIGKGTTIFINIPV